MLAYKKTEEDFDHKSEFEFIPSPTAEYITELKQQIELNQAL
jgi:hypothetical protein